MDGGVEHEESKGTKGEKAEELAGESNSTAF